MSGALPAPGRVAEGQTGRKLVFTEGNGGSWALPGGLGVGGGTPHNAEPRSLRPASGREAS